MKTSLQYWKSLSTKLVFFILLGATSQSFGQASIYTQNFGTGTSFPSGWSASGSGTWTISTSTASTTPAFSGGSNAFCGTGNTIRLTYDATLSTVGYTNVTVRWAAWRNSSQPVTFEWSSNGTTWNSVSYTDVSNNSTWALTAGTGGAGTRISLPAAALEVTDLRFRWTISTSSGYRIDDFSVEGCLTPTAYAVTGGGSYCASGSGVAIGLANSETGVNYQLKIGGVNTGAAVSGTGSAISFGNHTSSGSYSVDATRVSGGCTKAMTGTATVSLLSTPVSSVTGQTNITCFSTSTGTISIMASGGTGPYSYSVNNGTSFISSAANPYSYGGLTANNPYRIKVKDANGCVSK